MKKLVIAAMAASMVFASSAFALKSMDADSMKDATAQAGVSIAVDDIVLETWVGSTTYTDTDGTDGTAGSISITDKHTVKSFNAISQWDGAGTIGSPGVQLLNTTISADAVARMNMTHGFAHALSIDVGTCAVLSDGMTTNSGLAGGGAIVITGVVIGLPTLEITTSSDTYSVSANQTGAANDGAEFIQITTGDKVQHILGGVLEIAPH